MESAVKPNAKIVFDIVLSDPLRVDLPVFQLWLQGVSGNDFSQIFFMHYWDLFHETP